MLAARFRRSLLAAASAMACLVAAGGALAAPATDHPRLWINSSDLARLQSWAVPSNPIYANGLLPAATAAKADADSKWNWTTGKPSAAWGDTGSNEWEAEATEGYAEMFAFMSLVDPSAANRAQWAMRARVLLMWVMNQAALGPTANTPFRDPALPSSNRANAWGEAWPLTVDWIYASLSATDKATIRKVFLLWQGELSTVPNRAGNSPLLPGSLKDPRVLGNNPAETAYQQQNDQTQLRWAANNYSIGEMRLLTMMSLAFDPADDPPVNAAQPASQLGNSVRSYIPDALQYWLYQNYAVFEDPAVSRPALGLTQPNISLGLAAGGLPVEGSLYGESLGFLSQTLLSIETAGYADTAIWGPQVGFFSRPFWDQMVDGKFHMTAPQPYVPAASTGWSFMGSIYPVATYGDTEQTWWTPYAIQDIGPQAVWDVKTGNTARLAKERWMAVNVFQGGAAGLNDRISNIWGNSAATQAIFYYLMMDPNAAPPADPRPSIPREFVAPAIGSVLARTDWTPNATWFTYRCSWESINHESGDCGQFQFYRKGQWLTKEWSNYALDWYGYTSLYHNTLGVLNTSLNLAVGDEYYAPNVTGSQYNNGAAYGDPSTILSTNDNWAYALSDMTNLYNHPEWWVPAQNAMAVKAASRSIVWLNPDYVVIYDRATTTAPNLFKHFNLVLMNTPSISGNIARITQGGQTLTVQSLMPSTAQISEQHFWTTSPASEVDAASTLDTSYDRLIIQDPSNPTDTRFLTVLQGTDSGVLANTAVAVHAATGSAFDGAYVGSTVVMFPATLGQSFAGFTYQVPSSVTRHMITGLTPEAGYSIAIATSGSTSTVTVKAGTGVVADIGGVIQAGFPASAAPTIGGSVTGTALIPADDSGWTPPGSPPPPPASPPPPPSSPPPPPSSPPPPPPPPGTYPSQGHGAPTSLATEGFYYYDNWDQRVFQDHNGQWVLINDGGKPLTYAKTATGWQGAGAPEQLIQSGASYFDTVEQRYYTQQGSSWVLVLGSGPVASPPPPPPPPPATFPSQGHGAPTTLATEGFYYYDNWDQRVFWDHSSQWVLINDGGKPLTYTKTATGWQGSGAPEQLIQSGASYFDTVEQRSYTQQGSTWILVLPKANSH